MPPEAPSRPLTPALGGERLELPSADGVVSVYVAGRGPPALLVHSVNAAASAAEVRPLHEHLQPTRTVFSLDLPGFGFSDRGDRAYSPQLMTRALHTVLAEISRRCGALPVDAVALSLSCEFLARAASEDQARFRTITLVSPTGFRRGEVLRGPPGSTRGMPWLHRALVLPGWGPWLCAQLTRPGVIRFCLEKTWGSRVIDEDLWRYCVHTARQPGAHHAPLHFLAGNLFSRDVHPLYEALAIPVWMCHGLRGDFTDYRGKTLVEGRDNWEFTAFPTGALPFFEIPDLFFATWQSILDRAGVP